MKFFCQKAFGYFFMEWFKINDDKKGSSFKRKVAIEKNFLHELASYLHYSTGTQPGRTCLKTLLISHKIQNNLTKVSSKSGNFKKSQRN